MCRYYDNWCGDGLQYLDDGKCAKIFPSVVDREWICPIPVLEKAPSDFQPDGPLSHAIIDTTSLLKYINDSAINACIIVTKRVSDASSQNGIRLFNKYYCAGESSADIPYETWSR